jgi:hypothetical protein
VLYLLLAHRARSPAAPLVGFASAALTLAKTALYWLTEYFCRGGGCNASHNDVYTLVTLWVLPNGCAGLVRVCAADADASAGCGCSRPR